MQFVFLHGAPATGKFTVGHALAEQTGYHFFHNHIVVDAVLARHAFGTPGFVAERDRRWREFFSDAATTQPWPGLIFTFNPENTVPQAFIDWLFATFSTSPLRIISIELTAEEAAVESRLGADQRHQFKKLTDLALYRQLRATGAFLTPVIPRTDLRLDTTSVEPAATARAIARHLGLD